MLLFFALAHARDLELAINGPDLDAEPVRVVFPDVAEGPLPALTLPGDEEGETIRYRITWTVDPDGRNRLDVEVDEVRAGARGTERAETVAAPSLTFLDGETARVEMGSRIPYTGEDGAIRFRTVGYRVVAVARP